MGPLVQELGTLGGGVMLRRVRWVGVIVGSVAALLAGWLILLALPDFYAMIAYEERPGGVTSLTSESQELATTVWIVTSATSWCVGYFLGGVVAGRMARSSPGLNGAVVAVCVPALGTITSVAMILPALLSVSPEWSVVFGSENLGLLSFWVMMFGVFFPISVVVAYVGGRVGGRIRARVSASLRA